MLVYKAAPFAPLLGICFHSISRPLDPVISDFSQSQLPDQNFNRVILTREEGGFKYFGTKPLAPSLINSRQLEWGMCWHEVFMSEGGWGSSISTTLSNSKSPLSRSGTSL